jgi:hypothetical protein
MNTPSHKLQKKCLNSLKLCGTVQFSACAAEYPAIGSVHGWLFWWGAVPCCFLPGFGGGVLFLGWRVWWRAAPC